MSVAGNGAPALGATDDVSRPKHAELTVMDGLSSSKVTGIYIWFKEINFENETHSLQSNIMTRLEYSH
jgi:hypothetical protein